MHTTIAHVLTSNAAMYMQVDLPACNVTLLSTVNGTGNCNVYVGTGFFPAPGFTSQASLVLQLRLAGVLVPPADTTSVAINLHAVPVHPTPSQVTMLVTVPYRNLHAGKATRPLQYIIMQYSTESCF